MAHRTKTFDAVHTMRKIRDNLSHRFKDMTFAQQRRAMQELQKPTLTRTQTKAAAKRTA